MQSRPSIATESWDEGDTSGHHRDAFAPSVFVYIPWERPRLTPQQRLEQRLAGFAQQIEQRKRKSGQAPSLQAFDREALQAELEPEVAKYRQEFSVAIHIRRLSDGEVLFDSYGGEQLNPASNQKLLTTSAALDLLGPEYRFETRVRAQGRRLFLIGEGEPDLDMDSLQTIAGRIVEAFEMSAIDEIVVDDSAFSARRFGPGFSKEGKGVSYQAPSGALSLNFNTVQITVYPVVGSGRLGVQVEPESTHLRLVNSGRRCGRRGVPRIETSPREIKKKGKTRLKVAGEERKQLQTEIRVRGCLGKKHRAWRVRRRIYEPALFTGGALAVLLAELTESQPLPVRLGKWEELKVEDPALEDERHEVIVHHSATLLEIVEGLLSYSNNFVAEQIIRTLGWRLTGRPGDWDNGHDVLEGYWSALGHDEESWNFVNGSGLSQEGRVSATALVDLMQVALRTQEEGRGLIDVLPVAGEAGTLRTRLRHSGKRVRAKTGTLGGVSALSGVLLSENEEPEVAFSILLGGDDSEPRQRRARIRFQDRIVMTVLRHLDAHESIVVQDSNP